MIRTASPNWASVVGFFPSTRRALSPVRPTVRAVSGPLDRMVAEAKEAARGKDVYIDGGDLVRQALDAALVDEMIVSIIPIVLGRGESLWTGLEGIEADYDIETVVSPRAGVTHQLWQRRAV